MPANIPAKIDFLNGAITARQQWLDTHASKRPEHEVEIKRAGLATLRDIRDDYEKSIARAAEAQG